MLVATGRYVGLLPAHLTTALGPDRRFQQVIGADHLSLLTLFDFVTEYDRPLSSAVRAMREEMVRAHTAG